MTQDKAMEAARRFLKDADSAADGMSPDDLIKWAGDRLVDAELVCRAYLSSVSPPAEGEVRSDISFERAMELGAMVLKLHERGLELVNIKEKADEWTRNAQDYRSICYAAAPILAVKLRDALNDLERERGRLSQPSAEEARRAAIEERAT